MPQVACGSGRWLSTDAINTVYTVSGLSFQPKALILWSIGLDSATEATTFEDAGDVRWMMGFAAGTTDRRCVGNFHGNGAGSMTCFSSIRNDAVLASSGSVVPGATGLLDFTGFTSDGFTLTVDDVPEISVRYFWMAIGGSDVTNAGTGEITEPGAIGNASYTVGAGFQPTVAFFSGTPITAGANAAQTVDHAIMVGAATGTGTGNQFVFLLNNDEGSASADVDRYVRFDECLALMTTAGGNPSARATFNGFDSAGFDLNWLARTASTRRVIYLAIAAGPNVAIGELEIADTAGGWNTVGSTVAVTSLAFQPTGVLLVSGLTAENPTAGTSTIPAVPNISIGAFTSPTNRYAASFADINAAGNADLYQANLCEGALYCINTTSGTSGIADVDAVLPNGFRLIVDDDQTQDVTVTGFVALGQQAGKGPPFLPRVQRYRQRKVF